jgi:deazaflavin-dependent oxidoreductase (nitroreductase family)
MYRIGLGGFERLYGMRWIMLTTTGRRTGKAHRVVLDIVDHNATAGVYFVQPAYGRNADWVRNIQKTPVFKVQVGRVQFEARAAELSASESAEKMWRFVQAHPLQSRLVGWMLGIEAPETTSEAEIRRWLAQNFVVLAIEPVHASGTASNSGAA